MEYYQTYWISWISPGEITHLLVGDESVDVTNYVIDNVAGTDAPLNTPPSATSGSGFLVTLVLLVDPWLFLPKSRCYLSVNNNMMP
jgi:hypothetical protein